MGDVLCLGWSDEFVDSVRHFPDCILGARPSLKSQQQTRRHPGFSSNSVFLHSEANG